MAKRENGVSGGAVGAGFVGAVDGAATWNAAELDVRTVARERDPLVSAATSAARGGTLRRQENKICTLTVVMS